MYSPQRPPKSPSAVRLRGLFKEGSWCCDCQERPPAIKLQVKKEGRNHGRYFYTCQKPRAQQCAFFLWKEEAEPREQAVVLSNSRSEDDLRYPTLPTLPSTPTAPHRNGLLTPQTERRFIDIPPRYGYAQSPPKSAKARMMAEDTDEFGWDDDSEENNELSVLSDLSSSQATQPILSQPNFNPDQPYKAARTPTKTSPGKRKLFETSYQDHDTTSTSNSSMLDTPASTRSNRSSGRFPPSSAELCMTPTPTKYRDVISSDSRLDMSDLAREANAIMEKHDVVLPNKARDELFELLNRHHLKLQGANKGRDVTRKILKKKEDEFNLSLEKQQDKFNSELEKKDLEIERLKDRITGLRAQGEMDRTLIDSMHEKKSGGD